VRKLQVFIAGAILNLLFNLTAGLIDRQFAMEATRWGWLYFFLHLTFLLLSGRQVKRGAIRLRSFFGGQTVLSYLVVAVICAAVGMVYWAGINAAYGHLFGNSKGSASKPTQASTEISDEGDPQRIEQKLQYVFEQMRVDPHLDGFEPYVDLKFSLQNFSVFDLALDRIEGYLTWGNHGNPRLERQPKIAGDHFSLKAGSHGQLILRQPVSGDAATRLSRTNRQVLGTGTFALWFTYSDGDGNKRAVRKAFPDEMFIVRTVPGASEHSGIRHESVERTTTKPSALVGNDEHATWRHVIKEQREAMLLALRPMKASQIGIVTLRDRPERVSYASELESVFHQAGWTPKLDTVDRFDQDHSGILFIRHRQDNMPDLTPVRLAFEAAKIPHREVEISPIAAGIYRGEINTGIPVIFIGPRIERPLEP